jgi:hypothetical protein
MTTDEKFDAIKALARAVLEMRVPGDWYVSQQGVEITSDGAGILRGFWGGGATPQEAIEDHWRQMTEGLKPSEYLVTHAMSTPDRKHHRWNGYRWAEMPQRDHPAALRAAATDG